MRSLAATIRRRTSRLTGERGQALPLFMMLIFIIVGAVAIVTDISWFWVNQQRMQRAADAASLAGAVYLPGDPNAAYATARQAAKENGFESGVDNVVVTPVQDTGNRRKLIVTIRGPVDTFFSRIFNAGDTYVPDANPSDPCIEIGTDGERERVCQSVGVTSKAEYTLPVPMGSPQNYYGVGYYVGATTTTANSATSNSRRSPTANVSGGAWTNPTFAYNTPGGGIPNSTNANTNGQAHRWSTFGFHNTVPNDPTLVIEGIVIRLDQIDLDGTGTPSGTGCRAQGELSWGAGAAGTWSSAQLTPAITGFGSNPPMNTSIGSATSMSGWGSHTWTRNDLSNTNFQIRITWLNGPLSTSPCPSTRTIFVDDIDVQVYWHTVVTTTSLAEESVHAPAAAGGGVLAPHNFWGAMQSQGAPNIQGDAFMTKYETPLSTLNDAYDYEEYYNYGIDIPAGGSGSIWIFDPGFCAVSTATGTGESWTVGGGNGNATAEPVSAFFELWNTEDTPYDLSDDTRADPTGDDNDYRQLDLEDAQLYGNHGTGSCTGLSWHNDWWLIASGLPGNTTYRLHTRSTDKTSLTDQNDTTALNAFAIYASSTSGTPKVYGIGSMEAYIRLPENRQSQFYLAQIDAVHAGKTLVIELWDPGDTGSASGSLEILKPTASGYVPVSFDYAGEYGTSNSGRTASCNNNTGTNVTSVTTSLGSSGGNRFNGCWLTIEITIPADYDAPRPTGEPLSYDGGWWKIRYTIGAASGNYATDLTTWKVGIRGSPVHLVP